MHEDPPAGVKQAERNAVVYRCLTPDPEKALHIGNGLVGASITASAETLNLLVSRSDLWNQDAGMGAIAMVRIRLPGSPLQTPCHFEQRCDLRDGQVVLRSDNREWRVLAVRDHAAIVLDLGSDESCEVLIENWHEGDLIENQATWHENETSVFHELNQRVGVDTRARGWRDPLLRRAWGVQAGRRGRYLIFAVPGCANGLEEVRREAAEILAASEAEISAWLENHRRWWHEFWSQSRLRLISATGDAEYEERVWYVTMYHLGSGHGGPYPMRFNGGPWLLDRDHRSWDWGYWFQNMRLLYWPLFAAGHAELAREFFEMYWQARDFVREQTQRVFEKPGLCYPETQRFWGASPDVNLLESWSNPGVHRYFSGNLELCLLMENYWRATGDENFLKERLLPLLEEVLLFYRGSMKADTSGRLALDPANALETWHSTKNPMPDLCGLHHFLPKFVSWLRELGRDVSGWEEFARRLPPLPIGFWTLESTPREGIHADVFVRAAKLCPEGILLPAEECRGEEPKLRNMENAELYAVWPWGRVTTWDGPEAERLLRDTWSHRTWKHLNNGWAQDVPQLARMGRADLAAAASLEHARRHQRFPSGNFISPAGPHFHGCLTSTPFFDSAGVHAAGLHEMLLQSHDGIVRVCPATPREWSGEFALHALDGLLVEAQFVSGEARWIRVTAKRAGEFTVVWGDREERVALGTGDSRTWGESVALPEEPPREVIYPGCKVAPPLTARRQGHWHDEATDFAQIGLAEDGLYPAIRRSHP